LTISLIGLLILLIVICVVLYCARLLIGAFAIGQPFATLIYVVIVLICLLVVLQSIGGLGHWGVVTVR
jgi:hypothetical protein